MGRHQPPSPSCPHQNRLSHSRCDDDTGGGLAVVVSLGVICPGHVLVPDICPLTCLDMSHVSGAVNNQSFSRARSWEVSEFKYFTLTFFNHNKHNSRNPHPSLISSVAGVSIRSIELSNRSTTARSISPKVLARFHFRVPHPHRHIQRYHRLRPQLPNLVGCRVLASGVHTTPSTRRWLTSHPPTPAPPPLLAPRLPQPPQTPQITWASDSCCFSCPFLFFSHPFLTKICQKITKHLPGSPPTLCCFCLPNPPQTSHHERVENEVNGKKMRNKQQSAGGEGDLQIRCMSLFFLVSTIIFKKHKLRQHVNCNILIDYYFYFMVIVVFALKPSIVLSSSFQCNSSDFCTFCS
jgi:hypothetical protein